MEIGDRIRALRTGKRLSFREFAEKTKVGEWTVRQWERGATKPSQFSLLKVCRAFNISLRELLEQTESFTPPPPPPAPCPKRGRKDGIFQRWEPHEVHHFTKPYSGRHR